MKGINSRIFLRVGVTEKQRQANQQKQTEVCKTPGEILRSSTLASAFLLHLQDFILQTPGTEAGWVGSGDLPGLIIDLGLGGIVLIFSSTFASSGQDKRFISNV